MTPEQAGQFRLLFPQRIGVDYKWVLERAKEQYKLYDASLAEFDAKAWAIVSHFGSGAGVAAFAAIAGVAANTVPVWTAIAASVSFVFAVLAVVFATVCRRPRATGAPPEAAHCVRYIESVYNSDPELATAPTPTGGIGWAEAGTLGVWNEACVRHRALIDVKAYWLSRATTMKVVAIGALILPLIAVMVEKSNFKPADQKPLEIKLLPTDPK
jgi:hypothetical protein